MTIGIAARGPRAGTAVFEALRAVEAVSRGAIGGFATLAAIGRDDAVRHAATQRGGTTTLFTDGERTGGPPPVAVAEAPIAGLISSGPDRPEPLTSFVLVDARAGLVTGHRSPGAYGVSGRPMNADVLDLMAQGVPAGAAVDRVIEANDRADAGLIAVDPKGNVHARNTLRVVNRPDVGWALRADPAVGAAVAVLHNAIHPIGPIAALAADIAMGVMVDRWWPDLWITVRAGTPLELGAEDAVTVDADLVVQRVVTTDASLIPGTHNAAAIYLGAHVVQGGRRIGTTIREGNTVISDGTIRSISGRAEYRIGCRQTADAVPPRPPEAASRAGGDA